MEDISIQELISKQIVPNNATSYFGKVNTNLHLHGYVLEQFQWDKKEYLFIITYKNGIRKGNGYLFCKDDPSFIETCLFDSINNIKWIKRDVYTNYIRDEDDGSRWEGSFYYDEDSDDYYPYGIADRYDSEGNHIFHGTVVGLPPTGFGTSYYPHHLKQSECYLIKGKKYGSCCMFDRLGHYIHNSIFIDDLCCFNVVHDDIDNMYEINNNTFLSTVITHLPPLFSLNESECLDFTPFAYLQELYLEDSILSNCKSVMINNLNYLKRIQFNNYVLSLGKDVFPYMYEQRQRILKQDAHLIISNCPKCTQITFGEYVCCGFMHFKLFNLPVLKSLNIGTANESYNFYCLNEFNIEKTPLLAYIKIGAFSLYWCETVHIESIDSRDLIIDCEESSLERCSCLTYQYKDSVKVNCQYPSLSRWHTS